MQEATETPTTQSSSPINIAKAGQANMQATMKESVQTPSGTFKTTKMMDIPGFGKVHPKMISAALRDPREEVRRWGEGAQRAQLEQEKRTGKQFIEERKFQAKRGEEGEKRIGAVQEGLVKKRMALDMARGAVESDNVGQFSKANLAQRLGIPELQTAQGAQLITASKENLLSNMSRVSARAQNVWFEKRLNDMFPKIGQSKEANLTVQEMLEGEELLDEALVSKYQELEDQDMEKYGYPKGDLEKRARKEIEPLEEKIFERTSYRMRQLEEDQAGAKAIQRRVGKEVMNGTPLTIGMANMYIRKFGDVKQALSAAKKNGYRIPSKEDIIFYEKAPRQARKEV